MQFSVILATESEVRALLKKVRSRQTQRTDDEWTPIPTWPGYDITRKGRVRSWWDGPPGPDSLLDEPQPLLPQRSRYKNVLVYQIMRTQDAPAWRLSKTARANPYVARCCRQALSRLLLTAFDRPPRDGEVARHLDDIQAHNPLDNLAWGTPLDNMQDALRNGRRRRKKTRRS